MAYSQSQRKAFEFLLERYKTQLPFSRQEFHSAVPEWKKNSVDTYWSKQIKHLLAPVPEERGLYRVTGAFAQVSDWDKYRRQIATQVRRIFSDYTSFSYDHVIIYEFFMPLTNEGTLRSALDALFFKDMVIARLKTIGFERVFEYFARKDGESISNYLDRVCDWISSSFGGYSISHVDGRFRAAALTTTEGAMEIQKRGGRYLVDETTAVVRFVFPALQQNLWVDEA